MKIEEIDGKDLTDKSDSSASLEASVQHEELDQDPNQLSPEEEIENLTRNLEFNTDKEIAWGFFTDWLVILFSRISATGVFLALALMLAAAPGIDASSVIGIIISCLTISIIPGTTIATQGLSHMFAKAIGAQDSKKRLKDIYSNSSTIMAILSGTSIISLFVIPLILDSAGWSSDVVSAISDCLSWSAIGIPAVMMTGPIQSLLLAKGAKNPDDSSYRWWSNGINLSGLLIFIGSGSILCLWLDLGYMGGGISFSIAHFSRYAVAHLARHKKLKEYELPAFTFSFKRKIISEILLHSAPLVAYSTFELAWPFLTVIIMGKHYEPFGSIVLTVFSQYNQWGLVFAFSGLQTTMVITAKQFSAAQKLIKNRAKVSHDDSNSLYQKALEGVIKYKTNARRTIHAGVRILILSSSAITILVCAFPDPFIGFYIDQKDKTPSTKKMLYFATGISFLETFRSTILGALRSLDDIGLPILINIGAFWITTASLMGGLVYGANRDIEAVGISILSGMSVSSIMLLARFIYMREKELPIAIKYSDSQNNVAIDEVDSSRQSSACPSLVPLLLSSGITELNDDDQLKIQIPESRFDFFVPEIKCKSKYTKVKIHEEYDEEAEMTHMVDGKNHKSIELNQSSS